MSGLERTPSYDADSLVTYDKSVDFLSDPRFVSAYRRGMDSGHHICRPKGSSDDLHIEWRVHVALWAASHGTKLDGDFVECGVNTGMMSLAICEFLDFDTLGKTFWLFDTYAGIPREQITPAEAKLGRHDENDRYYSESYDTARRNFAPFRNAKLVRGRVPDSLANVRVERVAYLSLDMNVAEPEVAALRFFWGKLSPGAIVLLDDYAWLGYRPQKDAIDDLASELGVDVLTLPTGQGLIVRPPS